MSREVQLLQLDDLKRAAFLKFMDDANISMDHLDVFLNYLDDMDVNLGQVRRYLDYKRRMDLADANVLPSPLPEETQVSTAPMPTLNLDRVDEHVLRQLVKKLSIRSGANFYRSCKAAKYLLDSVKPSWLLPDLRYSILIGVQNHKADHLVLMDVESCSLKALTLLHSSSSSSSEEPVRLCLTA